LVTLTPKTFWSRQFIQIREEGWEALSRKGRKVLITLIKNPIDVLAYTIFIPVVIIVRLIRPFKLIRFGYFDASAIGHYSFDVEYYLVEKKLGHHPKNIVDLFFYNTLSSDRKPANQFLNLLAKRNIYVNNFVKYFYYANDFIPMGEKHKYLPAFSRMGSRDIYGLFQQTCPQLKFSANENKQGQEFLKRIGLKYEDRFVCMIIRDSEHLKNQLDSYAYHNYRDTDVDTYADAALALAEKGYFVFRMGKKVNKPFNVDDPRIVDYAISEYRSDFLDVWIMANCFFCISTGTGLDEIPRIFRRPAVYVNYLPLSQFVSYDQALSIPKHLVCRQTNRWLTLTEHLSHPYLRSKDYQDAGIRIEDNSAEEIKLAVEELESRLIGSWQTTEEDRELQDRFWQIFRDHPVFKKHHNVIHPEARVGANFLRNNPQWLN